MHISVNYPPWHAAACSQPPTPSSPRPMETEITSRAGGRRAEPSTQRGAPGPGLAKMHHKQLFSPCLALSMS